METLKSKEGMIPPNARSGYKSLSDAERRHEVLEYYLAFFPDSRINDARELIDKEAPEASVLRGRCLYILGQINKSPKTSKNENAR